MVCLSDANSSGTFLILSDSLKFDVYRALSRAGRYWGWCGDS